MTDQKPIPLTEARLSELEALCERLRTAGVAPLRVVEKQIMGLLSESAPELVAEVRRLMVDEEGYQREICRQQELMDRRAAEHKADATSLREEIVWLRGRIAEFEAKAQGEGGA